MDQLTLQRIADLGRSFLLSRRQDGGQLHLRYAPEAADELREIVVLERECCAFLGFDLRDSASAVDLTITAPAITGEFASALFEHFSASSPAAVQTCDSACGCSRGVS